VSPPTECPSAVVAVVAVAAVAAAVGDIVVVVVVARSFVAVAASAYVAAY